VALKIMADFLNDKYAQMWYEDAANFPNRNFFQLLAERPYYRTVLFYRLKIIGSIFRHFYPTYTHFNLPSYKKVPIGAGIYLDHPYSTVLAATSIGKNFKTKQLVTVGNNRGGKPSIGNNVFIGAGAVVCGGIVIGDNVQIGANAVVMKDVPPNCTVIGNPAIIVRRDGVRVNIPL
jgi:serine O-acetyltransferase